MRTQLMSIIVITVFYVLCITAIRKEKKLNVVQMKLYTDYVVQMTFLGKRNRLDYITQQMSIQFHLCALKGGQKRRDLWEICPLRTSAEVKESVRTLTVRDMNPSHERKGQ